MVCVLSLVCQGMEGALQQQREEMQALQEQIRELQQHRDVDQEALRQTGQSQKQRAEQSESHASQLSAELLEKVRWCHCNSITGCWD